MEKYLKMYDLQEILKAIGMPDGYKAENIQIVNGKICYELVEVKKSIKEIVDEWRNYTLNKTYYMDATSSIDELGVGCNIDVKWNKSSLPTTEKCEQILALEQLIMNCWIVNGGKELSKNEVKAIIYRSARPNRIEIEEKDILKILNFTSLEVAQEFYETYRELIEIAKPLL